MILDNDDIIWWQRELSCGEIYDIEEEGKDGATKVVLARKIFYGTLAIQIQLGVAAARVVVTWEDFAK